LLRIVIITFTPRFFWNLGLSSNASLTLVDKNGKTEFEILIGNDKEAASGRGPQSESNPRSLSTVGKHDLVFTVDGEEKKRTKHVSRRLMSN
jgi:hypothetical protein